jgi:hypothetical protein
MTESSPHRRPPCAFGDRAQKRWPLAISVKILHTVTHRERERERERETETETERQRDRKKRGVSRNLPLWYNSIYCMTTLYSVPLYNYYLIHSA